MLSASFHQNPDSGLNDQKIYYLTNQEVQRKSEL